MGVRLRAFCIGALLASVGLGFGFGERVDIGAMIRNSARDAAELMQCPPGSPITFDWDRRVLTCATSVGVTFKCVPLPSIAARMQSATPIAVAWSTPYPAGGFSAWCRVMPDAAVGVAVWRLLPPADGAAQRVDVWNTDPVADHGGELCCYATSQATMTPTPPSTRTPTPSRTPT